MKNIKRAISDDPRQNIRKSVNFGQKESVLRMGTYWAVSNRLSDLSNICQHPDWANGLTEDDGLQILLNQFNFIKELF